MVTSRGVSGQYGRHNESTLQQHSVKAPSTAAACCYRMPTLGCKCEHNITYGSTTNTTDYSYHNQHCYSDRSASNNSGQ